MRIFQHAVPILSLSKSIILPFHELLVAILGRIIDKMPLIKSSRVTVDGL